MSASQQSLRATILPTLRYRDLEAAATWLENAFGFELRSVERDSSDRIVGAQAVLGGGMVMLATVGESAYDALMRQPDEVGGAETQSCYIIVADVDAHYANSKSHGAEIVLDLQKLDHGGVGYLCRDLEGHLWSFGNSNPWGADADVKRPVHRTQVLAAVGFLAIGAAICSGWLVARSGQTDAASLSLTSALDGQREAREKAEAAVKRKSDELTKVSREKDALLQDAKRREERTAAAAREASTSREDRERELKDAVAKERAGKQKSERAAVILREQLKQERLARESAEKSRAEALNGLSQEKAARARAEANLEAALDAQVALEQQSNGSKAADRPVLREPPKRATKAPGSGSGSSSGEPMPDFRP